MVSLAVKFSELKFDITYRTSEMTAAQLIIVGLVVVGISWAWSSFSRARKEEEEQKRRERERWRSWARSFNSTSLEVLPTITTIRKGSIELKMRQIELLPGCEVKVKTQWVPYD